EHLISLAYGAPQIPFAVDKEQGSLNIPHIHDGRSGQIGLRVIPRVAVEFKLPVHVRSITCAELAETVAGAPAGNRSLEPVGMPDYPIGHVASVASPGNTHPLVVDPGELGCKICNGHYVLVVGASPIMPCSRHEFLPIAGAAPRVTENHAVSPGG